MVRVKSSDKTNTDSYNLTPNSPEPDTNWRDSKNQSKTMKPLVSGVKPPKMPKRKQEGLVKWLKSLTGIGEVEKSKTKKPINRRRKSKPKASGPRKNYKHTNNKKNVPNNTNLKKKPLDKVKENKKPLNTVEKTNKKPVKKIEKKDIVKKEAIKKEINKKEVVKNETVKKESPIKEIIKEKKVKKDIPTRAKNDPRQKN